MQALATTTAEIAKGKRCDLCGVLKRLHEDDGTVHTRAVARLECYQNHRVIADQEGAITRVMLRSIRIAYNDHPDCTPVEELEDLLSGDVNDVIWRIALCRNSTMVPMEMPRALAEAAKTYFRGKAALATYAAIQKGAPLYFTEAAQEMKATAATALWLLDWYGAEGVPATYTLPSTSYACRVFSASKEGTQLNVEYLHTNGASCLAFVLQLSTGRYVPKGARKAGWLSLGVAISYPQTPKAISYSYPSDANRYSYPNKQNG